MTIASTSMAKQSDRCQYGCRFLPILPELALCPHTAVGRLASLRGAVDEARALLERQGGYALHIAQLEDAEAARKKKAQKSGSPPGREYQSQTRR